MRVVWRGEKWDKGNVLVCSASVVGHGWTGELCSVHGNNAGEWPTELALKCMKALTEGLQALERVRWSGSKK